MTTQWKVYPGDCRYWVSSDGEVMGAVTGRMLKPRPLPRGYLRVSLSRNRDEYVHTMVLETFAGPRPAGHQASHLDGNPANNWILNLKWETPTENNSWKRFHGTAAIGERNPAWGGSHCKRGHDLSPENTRLSKRGDREQRICRTCARERQYRKRTGIEWRPTEPKTHCKHGHEFTPENTRVRPHYSSNSLLRGCKTCEREQGRRRYELMKGGSAT
jgi:hypothetical protein